MKKPIALGDFEQVLLLAILRLRAQGAYGVSIRNEIIERTGREPAPGAIYTTLDRLEAKGVVHSFAGEATPERGGRSKRYYELTQAGIEALRRVQSDYRNLLQGLDLMEKTNA
jgi:PadR family transcriptional regulator, regulatory protein PadR